MAITQRTVIDITCDRCKTTVTYESELWRSWLVFVTPQQMNEDAIATIQFDADLEWISKRVLCLDCSSTFLVWWLNPDE